MCWGEKSPKTSQSDAGTNPPGCKSTPCPLANLAVKVTHEITGAPIAGADVTVTGLGTKPTNAEGWAKWEKINPGTYDVSARKNGHIPDPGKRLGVNVPPNTTTTTEIKLLQVVLEIIDRQTGAVVSGTTQIKIVGQKVELRVRTRPAGLTMTNIQWTVPGQTVKSYTQSIGAATKTDLSVADLQAVDVDFYWIAGGNQNVQVAATVAGAVLTASVQFNVLAPTGVSFTGEQSETTLGPHFLWPLGLNAYNAATGHFGVQWNASCTAPAGGKGQIAITQLITRNFTTTIAGVAQHMISPAQVLDDGLGIQYSGPQPIAAGAAATLTGNSYADSPSARILPGMTVLNCSDQFTDFFMYKPSTPNSIWVTLSRLTWSWNGAATAAPPPPPPPPPSGFILGAHSPAGVTNQNGVASTTLPEWTANYAPFNHWTP